MCRLNNARTMIHHLSYFFNILAEEKERFK